MVDLGVNSDSINYEVAVEILGQARQPLMAAIRLEREKLEPSISLIKYFEARLFALDNLQEDLSFDDVSAIEKILDKTTRVTWL